MTRWDKRVSHAARRGDERPCELVAHFFPVSSPASHGPAPPLQQRSQDSPEHAAFRTELREFLAAELPPPVSNTAPEQSMQSMQSISDFMVAPGSPASIADFLAPESSFESSSGESSVDSYELPPVDGAGAIPDEWHGTHGATPPLRTDTGRLRRSGALPIVERPRRFVPIVSIPRRFSGGFRASLVSSSVPAIRRGSLGGWEDHCEVEVWHYPPESGS